MAKRIKTIHDRIRKILSKENGKYYSPEQIDNELHAKSMNLFQRLYKEWSGENEAYSYLRPFVRQAEVDVANGLYELPGDVEYILAIDGKTDESEAQYVNVDILRTSQWRIRVTDTFYGPEKAYPIARIAGSEDRNDNTEPNKPTQIEVLPAEIKKININYLQIPTQPKYAYSNPTGNEIVYNDASSVDFEWTQIMEDRIVNRTIQSLGAGMRDGEIIEFGNLEQQKEGI